MAELSERIRAFIDERARSAGKTIAVTDVRPLAGGACQDNLQVELASADPDGETNRRVFVLRSDASRSLPGSLARRAEFAVIRAVVARGIRTPEVRWPGEDLLGPGRSSYFMDWLPGETIAHRVLRAPELADARAGLVAEACAQLARIHTITPESADEPALIAALGDGRDDPIDTALALHRLALAELPEPHPAIELALRFLDDNRPRLGPRVLCHGDFRTGNLAVTPTGLSGVLDWEFAHWGDPMDDLGWVCVRDWRFGNLDRPGFGLVDRASLYRAYEAASGTAVDDAAVSYWELMGNVRWAIGALHQGERYRTGAARDIELIAVGKRALEIEYELVRILAAWERAAHRPAAAAEPGPGAPETTRPAGHARAAASATYPGHADILRALAAFLRDDVRTALDEDRRGLRYRALVAAHMADQLADELGGAEQLAADEVDALQRLLGRAGPLFELRAEIARHIRADELDESRRAEIRAFLLSTMGARLAVQSPRFCLARDIE